MWGITFASLLVLATCSLKLKNTGLVFTGNNCPDWVGKDPLDLNSVWLTETNPSGGWE